INGPDVWAAFLRGRPGGELDMAGKYDPAKRLIRRFPRPRKPRWTNVGGRALLRCGCGQVLFYVEKTGMERQRHTRDASHRRIVAVCPNPQCRQEKRLR